MRLLRRLSPLVVAACSSAATPTAPVSPTASGPAANAQVAPAAKPAPEPPGLRLGTNARPTRYTLDLTLVPKQDAFAGRVAIALELAAPTDVIWLHGVDLTVEAATFEAQGAAVGVRQLAATPASEAVEMIGFALDRPVGPGRAELAIRYRGKIYSKEQSGIFRQDDRGETYAYTQFESTDARRAFPCFDEPSFKVPVGLTLHVQRAHLAVANAPMVAETEEADGMKAVRFADTKPLPSYLVAFAVGPFEIVDAGTAGQNRTPLRVIVPKGRRDEAGYAARTSPELIQRLEAYFGMPFPYPKLDQIAIPRFGGAMENAGLITYGLDILLFPRSEESAANMREFTEIAAHEMAHHWFGDLVTLAWWDDIWLNESFASWMERVIVEPWQPTWGLAASAMRRRSFAMSSDARATARRIRQPIKSKGDITDAFDGITYEKGKVIIAMIERWVGPDKFQAAVRSYLTAHAHGTATTADFTAALSAANADVAPVLASFLDQAGIPDLDLELSCAQGQPPTVRIAQRRYAPIGSTISAEQSWQVPVCVSFGAAKPVGRACTVLREARGELVLPTAQCPRWVLGNEGGRGYYHVRYRGELQDRLLEAGAALTVPERLAVLTDLSARVASGDLPLGKALARIPALARDPDRHLTAATLDLIRELGDNRVPPALWPNRARLLRKVFGERARALGWKPAAGEPDDVRLLRPGLVGLVAGAGEDPALIASAKQLAAAWLTDRHAISPELSGLVLAIASQYGDRAWFDRLRAAAKAEKERKDRVQILGAMGSFRDPAIARDATAIALTDEFDAQESIRLVFGALRQSQTREAAYAFVKEHYDALVARLPRNAGLGFLGNAAAFCDEAHRADAEAFFRDKVAKIPEGPRALAQMNESARLCIAARQAHEASAAAFLAKW